MKDQPPEIPEIITPSTIPGKGSDGSDSDPSGNSDHGSGRERLMFAGSLGVGANPGAAFSALRNSGKGRIGPRHFLPGPRHFLLGIGIALLALVLMLVAVVIGLVVALLARLARPLGLMRRRRPVDTAPALEARPTARGWVAD